VYGHPGVVGFAGFDENKCFQLSDVTILETLMSKGFGSVQRKIAEVLAANVDDAFRVDELCRRVYGKYRVEKKQRVSVIRAAKALVKKRPDLSWMGSSGPGMGLVFFNQASVMSYARARLKDLGYSDDRIHAGLVPGGLEYKYIAEGGVWWLHVQEWIANQNNDRGRLEQLKPMLDAQKQQAAAAIAELRSLSARLSGRS